ncbi:hypothetical protein B0I35DRAFT_440837 [Stachybotrys elegans]|uniref:Uncharacterized protein n=1 Tax=Stachybotrys elegans TaxID=80388 RepID=A0A8K0WNY4_9HYPO|nr:hypothetical protein B0I35DRAFT_440837 [Stachybotrys elegans]
MVQDLIQCFICPSQFSNYEICIQHSQSYQFKVIPLLERGKELVTQALGTELSTEITALLTRAQILLHHGSESFASLDDINGIVRHEASGVDQGWDKESVPATVLTQPNGQVDATRRSVRIQCPHKDCDGEAQTFARVQELDRHYALRTVPIVEWRFAPSLISAQIINNLFSARLAVMPLPREKP